MDHEGTFIRFIELERKPQHKTIEWAVRPKDGGHLGSVAWYGPWRKYCFHVENPSVYEQVCLREIAAFCETRTAEYRKARGGEYAAAPKS